MISDRRTQIIERRRLSGLLRRRRPRHPAADQSSRWWPSGWVLLNRTTFGRRTFAVGGNPEAARLAGIDVRGTPSRSTCCPGVLRHRRGHDHGPLTTTGSSTHGTLYELDAIAAVIIGGTLADRRPRHLIGSILGVLIFTTITNLFMLNNLATEVQNIAKGVIIVVAVLLQSRARSPRLRVPDRSTLQRSARTSMSEPFPLPDLRRRSAAPRRAAGSAPAPRSRACTSNTPAAAAPTGQRRPPRPQAATPSRRRGDHRLLRARRRPRLDRRDRQQRQSPGGRSTPTSRSRRSNPTNDITQQIAAVETLINKKVSALVLLPERRQPAHHDRAEGHGRGHSR